MIKILHLASFNGNIGDNASHKGLEYILNKFLKSYKLTKIEMRNFYGTYRLKDKKSFNQDFINLVNKFDLFIFRY